MLPGRTTFVLVRETIEIVDFDSVDCLCLCPTRRVDAFGVGVIIDLFWERLINEGDLFELSRFFNVDLLEAIDGETECPLLLRVLVRGFDFVLEGRDFLSPEWSVGVSEPTLDCLWI